ncbi:MAG TPA: DUF1501 domain-containing protein [Pirellulales bacterium]|nr:DUF1501 domain-containing protein [Pirellulales bacterium]
MQRRDFLKTSLAAAGAVCAGAAPAAAERPRAKADSVIFIWLPGGVAQTDTWDTKQFTPFRKGMRGNELLGTCPTIPTEVDGLRLGEGLENMASIMPLGTVLRSLTNETKFGAVHLKAQYYMMTGYLFPVGVKAPSLGAAIGRTLGPRDANVPPYIYIGRDVDTSDTEKQFISEYIGPGFYGVRHAPFMIPDPTQGMATLSAAAGMTPRRIDRRLKFLQDASKLAGKELQASDKAADYLRIMAQARAMMDSPIKRAFAFAKEEKRATLAAYKPRIAAEDLLDPKYDFGPRFGSGLLLARRLVESGARFVQVEYQYGPFKGFDTHEDGATRLAELKLQIDGPIAQLIRDLDERGLLERTLVVVATEFGRTIANQPKAGIEPIGFAERQTGQNLLIENEKMYGFHGHFSSANSLLFFGGGFRQGLVYGRTADEHPMVAVEKPVSLCDVHATIYHALGIPPDTAYVTEGRPFHVTKDGKGRPIEALLA